MKPISILFIACADPCDLHTKRFRSESDKLKEYLEKKFPLF
jgi:hypothetical protein